MLSKRFPWNMVKGWSVKSLANGSLLIEPDYIRPYTGPEEGGGPGLFDRMALADWCLHRLTKRRASKWRSEPMKALYVLAICAVLAGCESRTGYGKCIGLGEDRDPHLRYKISGRNLTLGIIFIEVIAPPIIVATDEFYCPIGRADSANEVAK